jgi:hypothetical protein
MKVHFVAKRERVYGILRGLFGKWGGVFQNIRGVFEKRKGFFPIKSPFHAIKSPNIFIKSPNHLIKSSNHRKKSHSHPIKSYNHAMESLEILIKSFIHEKRKTTIARESPTQTTMGYRGSDLPNSVQDFSCQKLKKLLVIGLLREDAQRDLLSFGGFKVSHVVANLTGPARF